MAKYWAQDATFTHVSFRAFNRDDIWGAASSLSAYFFPPYFVFVATSRPHQRDAGVYQLWSLNNRGIGIDYLELICDKKGNSVLLEVVEHCNVWWFPPFTNQDVIINQYDHTLLVESILYHQFPSVGRFCYQHVLPAGGSLVAAIGNLLYKYINDKTEVPTLPQPLLVDAEDSIARAAELLFRSDPSGRSAIVFNAFATDAIFYSTFLSTVGREQIFGAFNLWANLNRNVEIQVKRVVPQRNRILVDAEQFFTPFFWPSFLHPLVWYHHILISTADTSAGGKLITRVDNHIITIEPFLRYNMGPLSWAYECLRIFNGKMFGFAGPSIYRLLEWYHGGQVAGKVAAHLPDGFPNRPSSRLTSSQEKKAACAMIHTHSSC
ncbi:g3588 [Coccomyxa elongata]